MLSRDPARLGVSPPRYEEFADTRGNKRGRDCLTSVQKTSNSNGPATTVAGLDETYGFPLFKGALQMARSCTQLLHGTPMCETSHRIFRRRHLLHATADRFCRRDEPGAGLFWSSIVFK